MKYSNSDIRRQDRLLDEHSACNLLKTGEYESIILECQAYRNLPDEERMNALALILDKYSPNDKVVGLKYAEKSLNRTEIVRLEIKKGSGKCKNIGK